jgi:hypothetical protein
MPPVTAIELYGLRVRVETMFAMLKYLIGAFRDHFWSKRLPPTPANRRTIST